MDIKTVFAEYLESKKNSWSASTLKVGKTALADVTEEMLTKPQLLFDSLVSRGMKPYSIKTKFVRVGEFVEFAMSSGRMPEGRNAVKAYMKENANKFKHAHTKKHLGITFEEAAQKIASLKDEEARKKALQLLYTGMRYTESTTLNEGSVVGKGGWHREVPLASEFETNFEKSYHTLYRALKTVGLTPHMLRKLCATKLVELGASEADLMKIMGWRSSQMASLYTQAFREKQLTSKMKDHFKKESEDGK